MPENIVGPHGAGVGETQTRPTDTSSGSSTDSWFRDCVNGVAGTGTKIPAVWLNKVSALLRQAIRGMNVPDAELDDAMLLKAIQKADRGLENLGTGAGLVFKSLNGTTGKYSLRRIKAGDGITIVLDGDDIVITNSAVAASSSFSNKSVFGFSGADQTWVVPVGVTQIKVKLWGAAGAGQGGPGGYTECVLPVTPGDSFKVVVGEGGVSEYPNVGATSRAAYGFGGKGFVSTGGLPPGNPLAGAHGGGGLTGVFLGSVTQGNARAIAGGGGGAAEGSSANSRGGSGNDPTNSGGAAGMTGQDGATPSGGGGGGGYTGGTAAAGGQTRSGGQYPAGEGGQGYVHSSALSQMLAHTQEFGTRPPNTTDPDYLSGVGSTDLDGLPPYPGGHGLAVIYY
jgi:hypothetical protein